MRDTSSGTGAGRRGTPAETTGGARETGRDREVAHESYAFACMRCGYGWEQDYDIVHIQYPDGSPHVVYYTNGQRVPSPLTRPRCRNCEGRVVRIMRPGRVSTVEAALIRHR